MSFRAFIALVVATTAVAYIAPMTRRVSRVSTLSMSDVTDLPGAVAPLGFFDPVGKQQYLTICISSVNINLSIPLYLIYIHLLYFYRLFVESEFCRNRKTT